MPPRWLTRAILLLAAATPLLLTGMVVWIDGWRSSSAWLLVSLVAYLLISVFWTRASKARGLFANASLAICFTVLARATSTMLSAQDSARVQETTWLLLGGAWCILLGALLIHAAAWLHSRQRPPLS